MLETATRVLLGSMFTAEAAGASLSGKFNGRIIVVQSGRV